MPPSPVPADTFGQRRPVVLVAGERFVLSAGTRWGLDGSDGTVLSGRRQHAPARDRRPSAENVTGSRTPVRPGRWRHDHADRPKQ